MRLIDADRMKLNIIDDGAHETAAELRKWVDNQPTVPAITLDWLREKMRGYASALQSTELSAVVTVMNMWEREQEG